MEQPSAALEATSIPPMWFVAPDGFHALPVDSLTDDLVSATAEFLRDLYPGGDSQLWSSANPYYASITATMSASGLTYAALGIFGLEGPGVAHCSFTVAAYDSDHVDVDVATQGTLSILQSDPLNDARWLDLPCGPAVSCVTLRRLAVDLEAGKESAKLLTGQIQVYIPFPTGPYTAVFTLETASMEYWGEFCDMTTAILQTVDFTAPEAASEVTAELSQSNG